jgi:hypothetical protein
MKLSLLLASSELFQDSLKKTVLSKQTSKKQVCIPISVLVLSTCFEGPGGASVVCVLGPSGGASVSGPFCFVFSSRSIYQDIGTL